MKKSVKVIKPVAVAIVASAALCIGGNVSAQTSAASPAQPMGHTNRDANADETGTPMKTAKDQKAGLANQTTAPGGTLSQKERDFVMMAAKGGMMEVHMGQMAEKMGQSPDVKKLGAQMVTDHTKVNNQLMMLANAKGVKLDTRHKMDKMDSANFDQMWLEQMTKDHQKDIAAFESEAKSGMDPALKNFAANNLPTLKSHLKMVKAAQGKMTKKS